MSERARTRRWASRIYADLRAGGPTLYLALLAASLLLVIIYLRVNRFLNPQLAVPGFPIDDGYIYSNYVRYASEGHFFQYNPGEQSGGVTSLLWYLLLLPARLLLRLFSSDILTLAVGSAYLLGTLLLALTAWLSYRLTQEVISPLLPATGRLLPVITMLAVLLNPQVIWAALSGLELPLSLAMVLLACYLFLRDLRDLRYEGDWPGVLAIGLLPWARPELLVLTAVFLGVVFAAALLGRWPWRGAMRLLAGSAGLTGLLLTIYYLGYGRPLPSSFYAKVRPFSPGKLGQATVQLWQDGHWLTVLLFAGIAITGVVIAVAGWQRFRRSPTPNRQAKVEQPHTLALFSTLIVAYYLALSFSLSWFGQENRYLLPMLPLVTIVLIGRTALSLALTDWRVNTPGWLTAAVLAGLVLVGGWYAREWAGSRYAVEAGNIYTAHIQPARWLQAHTPADAVVAVEPAGALGLLSDRRLVDVVGLTTSPQLGRYKDWPATWPYLRAQRVTYLLYYPRWLQQEIGDLPPWLRPVQQYDLANNLIAGDSRITLYAVEGQ